MKQTAMMEHIEWLKEVIDICHSQNDSPSVIQALEYAMEGAKAKLPMEKEQIADAFYYGKHSEWHEVAEQHYNETYEGKESNDID